MKVVSVECGDRSCLVCGMVRVKRLREKYEAVIGEFKRPKFLTLTIPNVYRITKAEISRLRTAFAKLRRQKLFGGVRKGLYAIEITPGYSLGWNLHLHAIIDGPYIPQTELAKAWGRLWGRDSLVVYIQAVRGIDRVRSYITKLTREITKGLFEAAGEIDKRVLDPDVLKGVRLVQPFGSLHAIPSLETGPNRACPCCGSDFVVPVWSERRWIELWEALDRPPPPFPTGLIPYE